MAQTKRKRRSKHRGTAAGSIEARGRTGRRPTADETKKQRRETARERRLNTPPTWKGSLTRAAFAAVILFIFLAVTNKGKNAVVAALLFSLIAVLLYAPAGYYMELYLYRRRQRKRETGR